MAFTIARLKLKGDFDRMDEIARLCRKGRNAAVEDWLLRQRGKRETKKQRDKSEATKLYHAITTAVPELDTTTASMLSREVNKHLAKKVDWRTGYDESGKRRLAKDDILEYEQRPPFSHSLIIPVRATTSKFTWGPRTFINMKGTRDRRDEFEIKTDRLPPKMRRKLIEISAGERKRADASIVYKPHKNCWFLRLPIEEDASLELDESVSITVTPTTGQQEGRADRPFVIEGDRPFYIGEGRYYISQCSRTITAEKEIGWQYTQRTGAGHGRAKRDKAIQRFRRQRRQHRDEFRRSIIRDVIRQCERAGAGSIVYREPTGPVKEQCWFDLKGVEWDWTRFKADLTNAAAKKGIKVTAKKLKKKELQAA